jgi:hypothetical protein
MRSSRILTLASIAGAAGLFAATGVSAAESFDNCTGFISALPATISTPGVWCVDRDLATGLASGQAIRINTSHVTIDCNDYRVRGSAGTATNTTGIFASAKSNITVRNCALRGFRRGVDLTGTGHVVEDNRFDANTYAAIFVDADAATIRRNLVNETGGPGSGGSAIGIYATGTMDITDNTVSGVAAAPESNSSVYGIITYFNLSGQILRNRVRGLVPGGTGASHGIYNTNSTRVIVRSNDVVHAPGAGTTGIRCTNSQGRAIDNVVLGFVTSVSGCTDDGNVLAP